MKAALTRIVGGVLFAALAFGCGQTPADAPARNEASGGAGAKPSGATDTCSLLTATDIQSVMGTAAGTPVGEGHKCDWPSADESKQSLVSLIVTGTNLRSYDEYAETFRKEMNADPATSIHRIDGPGLFAIGFNDMPMVQIYSGSSMVQVATFGNKETHALELAKKVVARIK
jgi:hypothetical protein